jgi:hypothetical protein
VSVATLSRIRGRCPNWCALVAALLLSGTGFARADEIADTSDEYQQKAARICGFLSHIEWPKRKFSVPDAPYIVGIYGADQISEFLREAIQSRQVKGRSVQVRVIADFAEIPSCHVLFVSRSETDRLRKILGEARREGVLTVGESQDFAKAGGVVQFVTVAGKVIYLVDRTNASREGLRLDGFILRFSDPKLMTNDNAEANRRLAEKLTPPKADPR